MEPIAVDVILYSGYPQHFMQGRSWDVQANGSLQVKDANGRVIAYVAEGRWEAVGYRYVKPENVESPPKKRSVPRRLLKALAEI